MRLGKRSIFNERFAYEKDRHKQPAVAQFKVWKCGENGLSLPACICELHLYVAQESCHSQQRIVAGCFYAGLHQLFQAEA